MIKKVTILLIFMSSIFLSSQIVNVENLRRVADTSSWSGYAKLNINITKNTNKIFGVSNRIRLQYKKDQHLWLFINDIDFSEANGTKLVNRNSQHLRYNKSFHPKITWEAFMQSQSDEISDIKFRGLIGTGFRFKLSNSKKYKWYLGSLIMFERENSFSETEIINNDWRNSSYFSFKLYPKENITIVSTSYFQPKLNQFSDYRISSQTTLSFKVLKNLSFTSTFTYLLDSFPVAGIVKEQYKLTNGLLYSF